MTTPPSSCAPPARTGCSATRTTSRRSSEPRAAGFTLLELLTVLMLITVLLGIGVGAFRKINLGRQLAVSQVKDSLRSARLFAVEQSSGARVMVDVEKQRLVATGFVNTGNWHFEDQRGWPTPVELVGGAALDEEGVIGRCLRVAPGEAGEADLGTSPSFDAHQGVLFEAWVHGRPERDAPLLRKGEAFRLEVGSDGGATAWVRVRAGGTRGSGPASRVRARADGALDAERWQRVTALFDGVVLRLAVDGREVATAAAEPDTSLWPDPEARIKVGSTDPPFIGAVDEVRLASVVSQFSESMPEGVQLLKCEPIHFDGRGRLDPSQHAAPARIALLYDGEQRTREVVVGLLGDVQ